MVYPLFSINTFGLYLQVSASLKLYLNFFNMGIIHQKFNETHILLIPKVKILIKITLYKPISLSNVISSLEFHIES